MDGWRQWLRRRLRHGRGCGRAQLERDSRGAAGRGAACGARGWRPQVQDRQAHVAPPPEEVQLAGGGERRGAPLRGDTCRAGGQPGVAHLQVGCPRAARACHGGEPKKTGAAARHPRCPADPAPACRRRAPRGGGHDGRARAARQAGLLPGARPAGLASPCLARGADALQGAARRLPLPPGRAHPGDGTREVQAAGEALSRVRLREARQAEGAAAPLPEEPQQVHHLHSVQQDAGRAGGLRELPPLDVSSAGRLREGGDAPEPGRLFQQR
mmetsp:Transcript_92224/g.288606  ORF Transcript_92224/g.288606 Transcript_92224/m.288606 type:complete len:270 (+) Transcript_92224:113-922(+)